MMDWQCPKCYEPFRSSTTPRFCPYCRHEPFRAVTVCDYPDCGCALEWPKANGRPPATVCLRAAADHLKASPKSSPTG
jgi:hypothetical protein